MCVRICPCPQQSDYKILCDDGCRDYTSDNWEEEECMTGESATNAVVAKEDFTESDLGKAAVQSLLSGGNVKVAGEWVGSRAGPLAAAVCAPKRLGAREL